MSFSTEFFAPNPVVSTLHFALHALGFPDAPRAMQLLHSLTKADAQKVALAAVLDELLENLSRSAEPPRALLNFSNLCDKVPNRAEFFERLRRHPDSHLRLARLLSFSQSLSDSVIRSPETLEIALAGGKALSRGEVRALARAQIENLSGKAAFDALRRFRRAQFVRIGLLDLESDSWRDSRDFSLVVRQISDLAQVVLDLTLHIVCNGQTAGFCVLLMGKGGARELNYSSDVDLIFLHENRSDALQIGQNLLRELGEISAAGQIYRVDLRLRPDGGNGALVTPLAYALSYYESFAGAWEWQALIKARVVAGDAKLGRRFRKFTRQITWARRPDDGHLREVFEMKKRSEAAPDGLDARNLKSGPGGIRDAEWVVQQLQMMIGPTHPRARAKSTLRALHVLEEMDALSPEEARFLRDGYLWERVAEHRLQLWNEQAIRVLPSKTEEKAALARRLGCPWRGDAAARWLDEEHAHFAGEIRALTQRLFWRFFHGETPEIESVLPEKWRDKNQIARLERLASGTPSRPLPAPLSRQIRAVLPGALRGLERAANIERALANFENLCEASGNRLSLLRSLDGSPRLSEAIWTILGGSQNLAQTLIRAPQLLDLTANRALLERPKNAEQMRADCRDYCLAFRDKKAALRRFRGREMLRIGLRDLVLDASPHEITAEIAFLAGACLDLASQEIERELRPSAQNIAFCVLAMGKFGGVEMHPNSDCDVIFAYATLGKQDQSEVASLWAQELIAWSHGRTEDGASFSLDARLRPHGDSGALAVPLDALRAYFENENSGFAVWERQALTRARFATGDGITGARLMALTRGVAFPESWRPGWSDELRHIKNRVETERGAKNARGGAVFDLKIGRGGLSDIEWSAQWLSMRHGAKFPALQTPNTRRQLRAALDLQWLSATEYEVLDDAYTWLRRAELRLQIAQEGAVSSVKRSSPDAQIWARALFPSLSNGEAMARFETEWETHTSRTREVFERVRDTL